MSDLLWLNDEQNVRLEPFCPTPPMASRGVMIDAP
ncbi:hypothetical protein C8N36_10571 [Pelagimonas varians]|uniref:Uncharacterized protein n=1 Tax=Pelagimonas varians TaxID=696760 RepID=A0A238K965_9RHOB|nr:hypothetical protein C8N36_10571 [Pelagimonas varians]SMX39438.1 hypothetical protein PEV8663_01713 [Pelagimonas varians]